MPDIAPTVAVIGGGQLARMLAEPAAALGIPLRLLAEAEGVSAAQVIPDTIVGDYRDLEMLRKVTDGAQVVTFDHEHVPTEHLHALAEAGVAVRPGPEALVHAQDKAVMRARLSALGVPCPRHAVVTSVDRRRGVRAAVRAQDHPWRVRRPGGVDGPRPPRGRGGVRDGGRDRRPGARRGARRLPSRAGRAGGALAEWPGRGVPRRRRAPSSTASATRSWRRRPTSTRGWPRTPSRSR